MAPISLRELFSELQRSFKYIVRESAMRKKVGVLGGFFKTVFFVLLSGVWAYGCLAIYFSGPDPDWLKITLAVLWPAFASHFYLYPYLL